MQSCLTQGPAQPRGHLYIQLLLTMTSPRWQRPRDSCPQSKGTRVRHQFGKLSKTRGHAGIGRVPRPGCDQADQGLWLPARAFSPAAAGPPSFSAAPWWSAHVMASDGSPVSQWNAGGEVCILAFHTHRSEDMTPGCTHTSELDSAGRRALLEKTFSGPVHHSSSFPPSLQLFSSKKFSQPFEQKVHGLEGRHYEKKNVDFKSQMGLHLGLPEGSVWWGMCIPGRPVQVSPLRRSFVQISSVSVQTAFKYPPSLASAGGSCLWQLSELGESESVNENKTGQRGHRAQQVPGRQLAALRTPARGSQDRQTLTQQSGLQPAERKENLSPARLADAFLGLSPPAPRCRE